MNEVGAAGCPKLIATLRLMAEGLPGSLPVLAVSNVTTPRETRLVSRLDRIGVEVAETPMRAPVLFVIGHVVSLYGMTCDLSDLVPASNDQAQVVLAGE